MKTYYVKLSNQPESVGAFTTYPLEGTGEAGNIELCGKDADGNKVPLVDAVSFDPDTSTYLVDVEKAPASVVEYELNVIPPNEQ